MAAEALRVSPKPAKVQVAKQGNCVREVPRVYQSSTHNFNLVMAVLAHSTSIYGTELETELKFDRLQQREFKQLFADNFKFMNLKGAESLKEFTELAQNDTKLRHIIKLFLLIQSTRKIDDKPLQDFDTVPIAKPPNK